MIVAGCDVGSATGKAVIMNNGSISSYVIIDCLPNPVKTAKLVMDEAVKKADIASEKIEYIVGTGYGRMQIPFADKNISEITCHGVGAHWVDPEVRTIIDIGGQDCKVIGLNDQGRVADFAMNDKCAAGTGRFFEAMARVMNITLSELSSISLEAKEIVPITSQCSVFAETEVISLLSKRKPPEEIAAGIQASVAKRSFTLLKKVGINPSVAATGGCAKNKGLIAALTKYLRQDVKPLPIDPQLIGALGAAVSAQRKAGKP